MYAHVVNSIGKQIVNGPTLTIIDRAWPDTGAESEREQKRKKKKKKRRTGQWRRGSMGKARGGECGANYTRPMRISVLASGFIFTTI